MKILTGCVLGPLVLASAIGGCGDDDGVGGSGQGGQATQATQSQSQSTTQSQGTQGGADGQGGAGNACYPDAPLDIELVVRNDTQERLWFKLTYAEPRLAIVEGEGDLACPCDDEGACANGGVASAWEAYGYLDPGQEASRTWNGFFYGGPAEPTCSCDVGRLPPAGQLTVGAVAYLLPSCDEDESPLCDCPLATGETCTDGGYSTPLNGEPDATASAELSFPTDTRVVVSFTQIGG